MAYSSLEQFVLSLDEENVDLVREGLFAESWLLKYYLRPENSDLKNLVEKVNKVVYSPKLLQCKKCPANSRNFYRGHCQRCSETGKFSMYLQQPKMSLQFQQKKRLVECFISGVFFCCRKTYWSSCNGFRALFQGGGCIIQIVSSLKCFVLSSLVSPVWLLPLYLDIFNISPFQKKLFPFWIMFFVPIFL